MTELSTATEIIRILSKYTTIAGTITFTSGIIGNAINILVFTHLKLFRNNRCIFYLIVESISDFFYQFFSLTLTILISLYGSDLIAKSLIWCKFRVLLAQLFGLITFYMICFQSADQYFSTNYHFNIRQCCTLRLAHHLALIIVLIWLLHSILCTFFVNIVPSLGCIISGSIGTTYVTFFFYPVLAGLLPIVISSSFSILAFRNVRHIVRRQMPLERRRFDHQITAMILLRVIFFVLFTLPFIVHRIYVVNIPISQANPVQYAIGQLLQNIMFSIANLTYTANFYLFFFSSSRYRRQVKYVLVKKYWRKWKKRFLLKNNQVHSESTVPFDSNIDSPSKSN